MSVLVVVLAALTTARLSLLLSRDAIFYPLRQKLDGHAWISELVTCPLCLSVWFGAGVAAYAWNVEGWALYVPLVAGSASMVACLIALAAGLMGYPSDEDR